MYIVSCTANSKRAFLYKSSATFALNLLTSWSELRSVNYGWHIRYYCSECFNDLQPCEDLADAISRRETYAHHHSLGKLIYIVWYHAVRAKEQGVLEAR